MKHLNESNGNEKETRQNEEGFNKYASHTDGYDPKFDRELQSVKITCNFKKVRKTDNQNETGHPSHKNGTNFSSRTSHTTSKEIEK